MVRNKTNSLGVKAQEGGDGLTYGRAADVLRIHIRTKHQIERVRMTVCTESFLNKVPRVGRVQRGTVEKDASNMLE